MLRFSTAVDVAVSHGVIVHPCRWADDRAAGLAESVGAELAGPRLSLSPSSLTTAPAGSRVVLPSPNGSTLCVVAAEAGGHVYVGCLRNASAVAASLRAFDSVFVVPAGERWPDGSLRPAVEDLLGAGAVIHALGRSHLSPEAAAAEAAFLEARPHLERRLLDCLSGRELVDRGLAADVAMASELDVSSAVPFLADGALVNSGASTDHA